MTEIVLFGGTAEGRQLAEFLAARQVEALLCVATAYGAALLPALDTVRVHCGSLDAAAIRNLLEQEQPRLVIDATHPYAAAASSNIHSACRCLGLSCLRLRREQQAGSDCRRFPDLTALTEWLGQQTGVIFSTLGAKEAAALTAVPDYAARIWLRILPDPAGLAACLAAGFAAKQIICMQGPFSEALNLAMFRAAHATILLTKDSGVAGGYGEKLAAAKACAMRVAVLSRPAEQEGYLLHEIMKMICNRLPYAAEAEGKKERER